MQTPFTTAFLTRAYAAAKAAKHIFPGYAASEAALESAWGRSDLSVQASNLFGLKAPKDRPLLSGCGIISMPTSEFLHDKWVHDVPAEWVSYPDWTKCFIDRMYTLQHLAPQYPHYAAALSAKTGEDFVEQVSQSWSTDPLRAKKVLEIHNVHREVFKDAIQGTPPPKG